MSPEKKRDFEAEWPLLATRLKSFLARKKVPVTKRDDLIQETALRLYKMWDSVDRNRPAWALTVTIALNLLRDEYRRAPHADIAVELPDIAQSYDVERAGLARVEIGRVRRALAEMTPAHRLVLLAEVGHPTDVIDAGAEKMRRMRARRKLKEILERVSAIFVLPAKRVSDLVQAVVGMREGLVNGVSCVLCTVLGFGVAVSVPFTSGRADAATIDLASTGSATVVIADALADPTLSAPEVTFDTDAPGMTVRRRVTLETGSSAPRSQASQSQTLPPLPPLPENTTPEAPPIPLPGEDPGDDAVPVPEPPPLPPTTEDSDGVIVEVNRVVGGLTK